VFRVTRLLMLAIAESGMASAGYLTFDAGLGSSGGAVFARPNNGSPSTINTDFGNSVFYNAFHFNTKASGTVTIWTLDTRLFYADNTPTQDTYLAVYKDSFDPAQPLLNLVAVDDDGGPHQNSYLQFTVDPDVMYWIVATTYSNGVFGSYTIRASADQFAPEPASLALCGLGLTAVAWAARRRRRSS